MSNDIADCTDKEDIIYRIGSLKCALILKETVNLDLSYPSLYLLSFYLITLHLWPLSFIRILILCVFVGACSSCVCALPWGACSLIEFFSHRSVWQVALLASGVCSVQVLSWVRSCHIHLHQGTIPHSPLCFNTATFHLLPKNRPLLQPQLCKFTIQPPTPLSSIQAHTAAPVVCTNIPNKISITCKVHLGVFYWRILEFPEK